MQCGVVSMSADDYTRDVFRLLEDAKGLARSYYAVTGRPLGCTGEIAEYEAARILGMQLAPVRQSGYDAIRLVDGRKQRVQIKGRHMPPGAKMSCRLGRIDRKNEEWDVVLLVLLDEDFDAKVIYEADRSAIVAALEAPGSKSRNERGQMSVTTFKSVGRELWHR